MKNLYLITVTLLLTSKLFAMSVNPALHIYTDNVENRFEVGETANVFVELMTDIEVPNGESEIGMDGVIIGFPPIPLEVTKISKTLYLFMSPNLKITDVGERYFQVQLKVRSKKTTNKIQNAIQANIISIDSNTISMNSTSDEQLRAGYQREIDRLISMNVSLSKKLNSLFTSLGQPKELGIKVVPKLDENVSVLLSQSALNIQAGEIGNYTIKLSSRPTSDVYVKVFADNTSVDLNGSQGNEIELLYTPENFDRPQSVQLAVPTKSTQTDSTRFAITHEAFSRDLRFNGVVIGDVLVDMNNTFFLFGKF